MIKWGLHDLTLLSVSSYSESSAESQQRGPVLGAKQACKRSLDRFKVDPEELPTKGFNVDTEKLLQGLRWTRRNCQQRGLMWIQRNCIKCQV